MLIIGGTGDLSRRHLLPALTRLLANGELPEAFSLTVTGLEPMPVEVCRDLLGRELSVYAAQLPADARRSLAGRISYVQADLGDEAALRAVGAAPEPLLVYVATPPHAVPAALRAISHVDFHRSARIVLDKPFGLSRASAHALNAQLVDLMDDRDVYRVDHFLYHHVVQELVRWRAQSDPLSLLEMLPVVEVEVVWDETRVAESSSPSYCGVLRDMVQSHLLQLVAVLTMEPPESMTRVDLTRSRLNALRRISAAVDLGSASVRGRHIEDGETSASSAKRRAPETFVTLALRSQMPQWEDVPFFLRAAKGVEQSRRHIELRLACRSPGSSIAFVRLEVLAGNLVIGLVDGDATSVEFVLSVDAESASTRLLRAALVGDETFTLDPQEPEESWRIVEPLLQAWEKSDAAMLTYPVGTSAATIAGGGAELLGA
jgi:glucose-6-phosphate 1-dehydrogenase